MPIPPAKQKKPLPEDAHYKLLRLIEQHPDMSQRELARQLGISLGKVNYCLQALAAKGWIKAKNFKNSQHKMAYAYLLTPEGIDQKAQLTQRFLKRKVDEYELLRKEIRQLKKELSRGE